jgi:short-subunit dehydrogenase
MDARRVFDANFWGVVYGCRAALPHLRTRGGTIVNLGSILTDTAVPFQGIYCASKHAVKGYTDALRLEMEKEQAPVSVTLVKHGSLDMPYLPPSATPAERIEPVTACPPDEVARAILRCAERPVREVVIRGGRALALMGTVAPRLSDLYGLRAFSSQRAAERPGSPSAGTAGEVQRQTPPASAPYTRAVVSDAGRVLPWLAAGLILLARAGTVRPQT